MDWIKVNNDDESTLPALGNVVWIVYPSGYDGGPIIQLGGRDGFGDESWQWGRCDTDYFARSWETKLYGIVADDDYKVTHWAEIEWPDDYRV